MAFKGIHPAADIEPIEFGLFAVAKPSLSEDHTNENEWTRGFSQEYITEPNYVRNWDETSTTSYVVSDSPSSKLYQELKPIFIEVEDQRSTFSLAGEDRFARVLKQLEGVSQKALEYELWNGEIALAQSLPNTFLTKPSVTVIADGAKFSPRRGLSLLEHYVGEMSAAGEHGVIHLTRDAFVLMTSNNQMFMDTKGAQHMQTASGAHVIIGSGYPGDGPHSNISTVTVSSNIVTVVTATPHYCVTGESVQIVALVGATDFGGTYTVTVTNSTTFTFAKTTGNISATAPTGLASAQMQGDDNTKWIYATGKVFAHLGKSEVVNDTLAQGYDVSANRNNMKIKATRSAIAYFDPSVHLAVKLDLTV
jgi:hypothetical protein